MAVFNRDVSSDETLRTAFQKQYVLMIQINMTMIQIFNDANQDDNDNVVDLDTKGIFPSFTMMLMSLNLILS